MVSLFATQKNVIDICESTTLWIEACEHLIHDTGEGEWCIHDSNCQTFEEPFAVRRHNRCPLETIRGNHYFMACTSYVKH